MYINKFILFGLLFLCGCQELNKLVPVVPQPTILHSTLGDYVNTDKGQVYLASNPPVDMKQYMNTNPISPNFIKYQIILPNKEINEIIAPGIKFGIENNSKSIVSSWDNGGQFAYSIVNNEQNGVYASNTIYKDLILNSAPDNSQLNVLYAPTVKAPTSCLEAGSNYWRGNGGNSLTYHYIRLFNFCDNVGWNTGIMISINNSFIEKYVRNFGNNVPQYTMEIIGSKTEGWSFQLFNYRDNIWDRYYTSNPGESTYNNGEGWDLAESHYTIGPCTILPSIKSNDIEVLENNEWIGAEKIISTFGDCFDNSINSYTYINKNNNWEVK